MTLCFTGSCSICDKVHGSDHEILIQINIQTIKTLVYIVDLIPNPEAWQHSFLNQDDWLHLLFHYISESVKENVNLYSTSKIKLSEVPAMNTTTTTTLCMEKNVTTLASCSFNKHRLIWIMFGKQHQHTFRNDMHVQLSFVLHFYLLYLLLNSYDKNDVLWRH